MSKRTPTARRRGQARRRHYAVGEASRERILEAAERVLARDGYHAFSTRRVAQECSISVGNLTYYFPTKNSLIEASMEALYERYERRYTERATAPGEGAPDRLADRVTEMLRDALDPEATGLFLELWIMARHDAFAAQLIDKLYERSVHAIAESMSREHPELSSRERLKAAYFVATLVDGVGTVFARPGRRAVGHEEIIPLAVDAIEALLGRHGDGG